MLTSPRTTWILVLAVGLTLLSSCGEEAHTSTPTQAIGQVPARRTGPASHLLATDRMPTAGGSWSGTDTADDLEVLGPCHLASLVDIGALAAVRRTWKADGSTPRAVQVVARFADTKSAWRAQQVLASWRADCGDRVAGNVGPMREVTVATGDGQAYRVSDGELATDLGILRKGAYLSVVAVVATPTRLPADSATAKAAVKRIAATF